tara:strand:- start:632 stop:847 length:216 start_codon:yes stop_codon:yes gene_type:complete
MGIHENVGFNTFPQQGADLGAKVIVAFAYDTRYTLAGVCVRNDIDEPGITIFHLEDGRFVLSTECQYRLDT